MISRIRNRAVLLLRMFVLVWLTAYFPSISFAADSFQVAVSVAGFPSFNVQTADGQAAIDYFKETEITKVVPGYAGTQPVAVEVKYQGVKVEYQFLVVNSNVLTINIPKLGIVNKTFNGTTRQNSRQMALDYLRSNGYLSQLIALLTANSVAHNPVNPVAGNAQSFLNNLVQNDYDQQFLWRIGKSEVANELGVGFRYGATNSGEGIRSQSLIPFYRYKFKSVHGSELSISSPIVFTESNEYQSYQVAPALSYRMPVTDNWSIGAGATYAVMGVSNWIGLVSYGGASISSDVRWDMAGWRFAVGNMIGYYRTFKLADYEAGLRNVAYRNGLVMSHTVDVFGTDIDVDYFVIDTRYAGSSLSLSAQQEVGIALRKPNVKSNWRLSARFIPASDSTGFIDFNYSF